MEKDKNWVLFGIIGAFFVALGLISFFGLILLKCEKIIFSNYLFFIPLGLIIFGGTAPMIGESIDECNNKED